MKEKPIESWQLADWNRALFQHYFADPHDNIPITRLTVTSDELSKEWPLVDPKMASQYFLQRKTLAVLHSW